MNPDDNLLNFITALASRKPDSTIAINTAIESGTAGKLLSSTLLDYIAVSLAQMHSYMEIMDLKNLYGYYISNSSVDLSYYDVDVMCRSYSQYSANMMTFFSDEHVRDFLTLFKSSK